MVIRELYVKNFGELSERHFYLKEGLQVIAGENESGKSTLHAFIRAMLFGMERKKGRAAQRDDFTRYEPWEDPSCYAGMMRFTCGGRNFRLTRSFSRADRRSSLVCEDDGEELSVEQGDLRMLLGGLDGGLFDSTVSVGQLKAEPGAQLSDALENYTANYMESGGGDIDLSGAFRTLQERQREIRRALKEEETAFDIRRGKIREECAFLERDMERLQAEYREKNSRLQNLEQVKAAEQERRQTEKDEDTPASVSAAGLLGSGAAGLLAGTAGILWSGMLAGHSASFFQPLKFFAALVFLAGAGLLAAGIVLSVRNRKSSVRKEEDADFDPEYSSQEDELKKLRWETGRIRDEWKEKEISRSNLEEQYDEVEKPDTWNMLEQRLRALEMAEEELEKAAKETKKNTQGFLNQRISEIFSALTEGKYKKVSMEGRNSLFVWDGIRQIPADRLSRGTLEQIYFSVRMAAAEVLLEEPVPLIFDDAFAFYDEKRLKSALKWLSMQKNQVIIFTCHNREKDIIEKEVFS